MMLIIFSLSACENPSSTVIVSQYSLCLAANNLNTKIFICRSF